MKAICTITTLSHLPQSLAMATSVQRWFTNVQVHIFCVDKKKESLPPYMPRNVYFHFMQDDYLNNLTAPYYQKHRGNFDHLRWSMKPVMMEYLLTEKKYTEVLYADNDLFFFAPADFLFQELDRGCFLLCPHWRIKDPAVNKDWFEVNFKDGLYNGGLVGATNYGVDILQWWGKATLYACEANPKRGLFVDQKYLDLLPAEFDDVIILRHRGCNVAYWNQHENKRTEANGKVVINGQYPIVFIHFTSDLIKDIESGKDGLLKPHLAEYKTALTQNK